MHTEMIDKKLLLKTRKSPIEHVVNFIFLDFFGTFLNLYRCLV